MSEHRSEPRPHLSWVTAPTDPVALVLVLHGGRQIGHAKVRARQLSVVRMLPIANRIAHRGRGKLAVARLRYAVRGWNGAQAAPVADAEWALTRMTERFGDIPIGLVGHSMGGRTALRVAGHSDVRSVAALAPWLPRDEPMAQLAGRQVMFMHGTDDRMTSPRATAAVSAALRSAGVTASFVEIVGEHHAMLRQPQLWHDLVAGFMAATLLGRSDDGPTPILLQRVIAGEPTITV
jgi:dienelactone hydrolase